MPIADESSPKTDKQASAIASREDDGDAIPALPFYSETALRIRNSPAGGNDSLKRDIAGETPVSITYNGLAYAVMMATPVALDDFAAGFSLTQGAIASIDEISGIDIHETPLGFVARIQIPPERYSVLVGRRRNVVGQTGCGMCGIIELEKALLPLIPVGAPPSLDASIVFAALASMRTHQPLHEATGAMHGAAFFDADGKLVMIREDVGRHNAFDKLIGAMLKTGDDPAGGFAVLTSRCSYELVEKAVIARIPVLVTVSAPTSLAVERARQGGLTLISLARPDSALVFNDPSGMFGAAAHAETAHEADFTPHSAVRQRSQLHSS